MGDIIKKIIDEILRDPLRYYLIAISFVAVIMTVRDKRAAKKNPQKRVPEARLFLTAILGGSVFMLATMLMIRHKTKHASFMVGIPIIIALQFALAITLLIIF